MKAMTARVGSAASSAEQVLRPGFLSWLPGLGRRAETGSQAAPPPKPPEPDAVDIEPTIYRFILKHSKRQQIMLLVLTLISFPFLYYSLKLPKTIVNRAIGGKHFPQDFLGFQFDQVPYLMLLCGLFLLLVLINGGLKYCINTFKGQLGERMLRRFRFQLYQRLLRFPTSYFHKTSSAQIIPMITVECEPLGGFIGDAFVQPLFQGGQLLTIIFFMFMQDPILGFAAIALYPLQGYLIPRLQAKVNRLSKQRVRTVREVADRVQESAAGITEIHANDTVRLQLADFAHVLGRIYDIRFEIYQRKFFAKFLNNFIGQLTPFFFFSIGGYLVIEGTLSFGALVAILAAYKDLASPWKELLDYYQIKESSRITYEQIVEQFQPDGMVDSKLLLADPADIPPLVGEITVSNLTMSDDDRPRAVDAVSFTIERGQHVAIIGESNSGKSELAQLLARLVRPDSGRIAIGGVDIGELPVAVIGRRIGYVGSLPYLFAGTLRDNLLLGLRHQPVRPAEYDDEAEARRRERQLHEARNSGNIDLDLHADWIDYGSAGVSGPEELQTRVTEVLARLDFEDDIYAFGLRGRLDPAAHSQVAERVIEARKALARKLADENMTKLVEVYDLDRYNRNATVAENLLFGTPIGPAFDFASLADNRYVLEVLDKVGLTDDLVEAGREVAEMMTEMFSDLSATEVFAGLPAEHDFFEQFSLISAGDLPEFKAILAAAKGGGSKALPRAERNKLLSLPFKLIAARHRLDVLDEPLQQRLLEARRVFRADLPEAARDQIEFFDPERYNAAASLQDNILFGKIAYGEADAAAQVLRLVGEVLDQLSLRAAVVDVGLDYHVGTAGSRLSAEQRQRAGIARALLKRPDLLILNEATTSLDGAAQARVSKGLRQEMDGRVLIWALHRASLARDFDRVLVMSNGRLQEQGRFDELDRKDSLTGMLLAAE